MIPRLDVTQADIEESRARRLEPRGFDGARYHSERDCPLGIALARQFVQPREAVRAHPDFLRIGLLFDHAGNFVNHERAFRATQTIRDFMRAWDRHGRAQPKRFALLPY